MARNTKKAKQRSKVLERVYLILTLVAVAGVAVFLGYVVGQYAIQAATGALDRELTRAGEEVRQQTAQSAREMGREPSVPVEVESTTRMDTERHSSSGASEPIPSLRESSSSPVVHDSAPSPVPSQPSSKQLYRVQVGAFSSEANARSLANELANKGYQVVVIPGSLYRVQAGAFSQRDNAETLKRELEGKGYPAVIILGE
ncbi:MAG: SPOR domain-containing protein [Firmicutes bacterium]|nr:SPOR domain-containing protein [Bacillota bacterium]